MSYLGYRVKIGDTIISNDLIQKGTYNFNKAKRICKTWNDADLVEHQDISSVRKVNISFSLRERNLTEQESVNGLFGSQENLTVTFWDDYDCEYRTSTFYMDAPDIQHLNTIGGINYAATSIKLTEY